jgi:C1A family cysteine protease
MAKKPRAGGDLQSALSAAGYPWTAGTTSVSNLSLADKKGRLGLIVDPKKLAATEKAIKAAEAFAASRGVAAAAPAAVDWRNNSGNWVSPIRDQGQCGSCVSFGTCATIEARLKIACKDASLATDLSEAHLFSCGCGNCCDTGWDFELALNFAKGTGVGLESAFPYVDHDQACRSVTPYIKLTNWTAILPVVDRKSVLAAKGPMLCGMEVFEDFYSYTSGVYRHLSGQSVGYHAVCVVGYNDAQKCWIVKNSWGTGWGQAGFFQIGYGECGMDTQFAFYDVDLVCPGPGPTPPPDQCAQYLDSLKKVLVAAQTNRSLRACLRYYVCGKRPRPQCSTAILNVVRAVLAILEKCPQYRTPFCRALG